MKKLGIILILITLLLPLFSFGVRGEKRDISVFVNEAKLTFDVEPIILQDRTMVPMRKIFETLGAVVNWNGKTKEIKAVKGSLSVMMQIDNLVMTKNGSSFQLDVAPTIKEDRTLVPIRAVSESFGAEVEWDAKSNAVRIVTKKVSSYKGYEGIPDYGETIDCEILSDKTSGKTRSILYQLSSNENDEYETLLEEAGFKRIGNNKTKTSITNEYQNPKMPKTKVVVVSFPGLRQTRIDLVNTKIKIFIDAGHNDTGADTGASGNGLKEQDITYSIAKKLGVLLQNEGIEVKYSRVNKKDNLGSSEAESIDLRSKMANDFQADYFISIHCNAHDDASISGTETFVYALGGQAEQLANAVQNSLIDALKTQDRKVKVANFGVLRKTKAPAILIEAGFITNEEDAIILKNKQDTIAKGIFEGICEFLSI